MSWLLDTDVMCQPVKDHGNPAVIDWLDANWNESYTSTIVIGQVAYWIRTKEGRNRLRLQTWLTRSIEVLGGRILSYNISAAHIWAEQKFSLNQKGYAMPIEDSYIAATARRYSLTIVTGNEKDFRHCGVKVFNPFK